MVAIAMAVVPLIGAVGLKILVAASLDYGGPAGLALRLKSGRGSPIRREQRCGKGLLAGGASFIFDCSHQTSHQVHGQGWDGVSAPLGPLLFYSCCAALSSNFGALAARP